MENCEAPPTQDSSLSRDVYALLAQANLFRMRGCWEEATEKCMAALRLTPDSHSAQSLLGDIYENQGRYEDAAQWYRMALDLNPDSPADRAKLERLRGAQETEPSRIRLLPDTEALASGSQEKGRPSFPLKAETALRVVALVAALLVFLVVAFAYVTLHRRVALSALGLSSTQELTTRPVVVPLPDAAVPLTAPGELRDASEQSLFETLRASQSLSSEGIVIYDVKEDPRTAGLELTYGVTPNGSGLNREAVLRSGLRLAQAASQTPMALSAASLTVRFLQTARSGAGQSPAALVFVGDIPRASVPAALPADLGLTAAQVQAVFGNPWWSPQFPG